MPIETGVFQQMVVVVILEIILGRLMVGHQKMLGFHGTQLHKIMLLSKMIVIMHMLVMLLGLMDMFIYQQKQM